MQTTRKRKALTLEPDDYIPKRRKTSWDCRGSKYKEKQIGWFTSKSLTTNQFIDSVLLFDGSIKSILDVDKGDELMGHNSKPVLVIDTTYVEETGYQISLTNGDFFHLPLNGKMVMSLPKSKKRLTSKTRNKLIEFDNDKCIISVKDFLTLASQKRELSCLYLGVCFNDTQVCCDPLLLGLWLGDGDSNNPTIFTNSDDVEIISYLDQHAKNMNLFLDKKECSSPNVHGYRFSVKENLICKDENPFCLFLKKYNLIKNKHIPDDFIFTSRENRLRLLAGLIDTDGTFNKQSKNFTICLAMKQLLKDTQYLCRSLGFRVCYYKRLGSWADKNGMHESIHYTVTINGPHLEEIPCLLPRKQAQKNEKKFAPRYRIEDIHKTNIKTVKIRTLDDSPFLLSNFMVGIN